MMASQIKALAPAQLDAAPADGNQRSNQRQQAQNLTDGHLGHNAFVHLGSGVSQIQIVHGAERGSCLDLLGVADQHIAADYPVNEQADKAVADTGEGGQLSNGLGNGSGGGVQRAGAEADGTTHQRNGCAHQGVIAHGANHHNDNGCKGDENGNGLGCGNQGADQHQRGDESRLQLAQLPNHDGNQRLNGIGLQQNIETCAHEHGHENQGGLVGEALDDHAGNIPGLQIGLLHKGKLVGNDHFDSRIVYLTCVLAGGNDPGNYHSQTDNCQQNHKGMGHLEGFLR